MHDALDRHWPLGCFEPADMEVWAAAGGSAGSPDDELKAFLKAQFLRTTIGPSFGADVERGLAEVETRAALTLAVRASPDGEWFRAKTAALRSGASRGRFTSLVDAVVRAALDHEERRLMRAASAAAPSRRRRATAAPLPCDSRGLADRSGRRA